MAKIPIKIKRAVRAGNYDLGPHCAEALADDGFTRDDAIKALLTAEECARLTDDETNDRWIIYGYAGDDRAIDIVVTMHQGTVIFKTAYEG